MKYTLIHTTVCLFKVGALGHLKALTAFRSSSTLADMDPFGRTHTRKHTEQVSP